MDTEEFRKHLFALIYCGGGGTRLWPYSREKTPKQFLSFNSEKTLIRKTFERIKPALPIEHIFVITLPDYTDEVRKYLPEIPAKQVIVEPARRDTLLAAGLGSVIIRKKDPHAIIANLWSDQLIEGVEAFRDALFSGADTAWEKETLVTTGVRPEYAHKGLEYVRKGKFFKKTGFSSVFRIDRFIERPERSGENAEKIFKDSNSLWHIGLWIWKADVFLEKTRKNSRETYERLMLIQKSLSKRNSQTEINKVYSESPKVQIDMVISKDTKEMYVVEGKFKWLDLGDFNVLWRMNKKDQNQNATLLEKGSEWIDVESQGCYVVSTDKKLIATVGLRDMVVVSTNDAIMVVSRNEAQKVKQMVNKLKELKKTDYL